jgi:DNA polymerase-4
LPITKVSSIDEMVCELIGSERQLENAIAKAQAIKQSIYTHVSPALSCSVGIAPNRYIAKLASDMQKPNGLTVIHKHELPDRLLGLKLRDLVGVGARMEKRLNDQGCRSMRTLLSCTPAQLRTLWGSVRGEELWHLLRGEELEEQESTRRTVGHSHVLPPTERSRASAEAYCIKLLSKAAMRMREEGFYCKELALVFKCITPVESERYWECKARFPETQDTEILLTNFQKLFSTFPPGRIVLRVGVALNQLVAKNAHQYSFFEDRTAEKLMGAVDRLNKKHRKDLLVYAGSLPVQADRDKGEKAAAAPIAFGHIPEEFE